MKYKFNSEDACYHSPWKILSSLCDLERSMSKYPFGEPSVIRPSMNLFPHLPARPLGSSEICYSLAAGKYTQQNIHSFQACPFSSIFDACCIAVSMKRHKRRRNRRRLFRISGANRRGSPNYLSVKLEFYP